jgi:uncharacterized protein
MFLLKELLILSPLAVYTYVRVFSLIRRAAGRIVFSAAFVAVLAGFPVAESLSHRPGGAGTKAILIAGYDTLPLLLYLVLAVILTDLAIAAGRLTGLLEKETVRAPRFRSRRLGFVLTVPVLVVLFGVLNNDRIRVKEYAIEVPGRASTLKGLTIAFAADFHLGALTDGDFMDRFASTVNAAEPDIVLIGGDVLEGDRRDEDTGRFEAAFRRLHPKYGVYGAPGNHEGHGRGGGEFFQRAGVRLLEDAVVRIDDAFYLAGRNDAHSRARKTVDGLLAGSPGDLPVILISHRPVDFENVSRRGVDVMLSGHTHDGQLFPVNWITAREYELSWGYLKKGPTHFFVTSGLQVWGPPVRTAGASEVLVIRVAFKDGTSERP